MTRPPTLSEYIGGSIGRLLQDGEMVDSGHWQGVPTQGKPDLITKEVLNVQFAAQIPPTVDKLQQLVEPNLPWAETEHLERVGGVPHNPHHSLNEWPWWRGQEGTTMHEGMFSHTYSERFWPHSAGNNYDVRGIRYHFGDAGHVVDLLRREPHTRQAYLPIFFPEDTGAVHGGRVPCTLGYHFLVRQNHLHCWYEIRSCDAVRHFRDDIYLACRLVQWVISQLQGEHREVYPWSDTVPGTLYFTAHSFHVHMGDIHLL